MRENLGNVKSKRGKLKTSLFFLGIFEMTTLEKICEEFSSSIVEYVVCSRDHDVHNDYYEDILSICVTNKIVFFERNVYIENNVCIKSDLKQVIIRFHKR